MTHVAVAPFRWRDGERLVLFGRGCLGQAGELLEPGYVVLTTPRASAAAPDLLERAAAVHEVPPGRVDELAGELRARVEGSLLVALGGGRVIDVAKALAAADPPRSVAAIPTTLSGAEMTSLHRKIDGREQGPSVRPALVLADPALMTSLPEPELRMSAMNALAHAVEALYGPGANPVATLAALRGAELIAAGDRALGSLLCAYAVDSAGYAVHHVLCQTTVRVAGTGHAETNAAVLPQTLRVMLTRAPEQIARLGAAMSSAPGYLPELADRLGGGARVDLPPALREAIAARALERRELAATPGPPVTGEELVAMLAGAARG